MEYQLDLDWESFLRCYWQKKPVILKNAIKGFIDLISPDELAGLAMENEIDSRLVSLQQGRWSVEHGPFSSFDHLGETEWTLLVQAVNHWHEPSSALMLPFRALPDWRVDDLMISFSVPGGGVGPHLDNYDVFIIQGQGCRRWRVGERQHLNPYLPHPDLLQVEPFEAILDEELVAGDILYIPPGFPHEGYSLVNSLNYSVGFRAPNARELLSGFADYVLEKDLGNGRYSDPQLTLRDNPACVEEHELKAMRHMMDQLLNQTDDFNHWFGEFITESRHELDICSPEPPYQPREIYELLRQGETLRRLGGLRVLQLGEHCYINGEKLDASFSEATGALARHLVLDASHFGVMLDDPGFLALLSDLINSGYWYFID